MTLVVHLDCLFYFDFTLNTSVEACEFDVRLNNVCYDCFLSFRYSFRRLDGTMTVSARQTAVDDFNTQPEVTVMLVSLKAASLGLNLVSANHVVLMDLWYNPATEDQAIDRAHRIGQTKPVHVTRITIKDTVEDRILQLQEKKQKMVDSALGEDGAGGKGLGARLTLKDLNFLFGVSSD